MLRNPKISQNTQDANLSFNGNEFPVPNFLLKKLKHSITGKTPNNFYV